MIATTIGIMNVPDMTAGIGIATTATAIVIESVAMTAIDETENETESVTVTVTVTETATETVNETATVTVNETATVTVTATATETVTATAIGTGWTAIGSAVMIGIENETRSLLVVIRDLGTLETLGVRIEQRIREETALDRHRSRCQRPLGSIPPQDEELF